MRYATPQAFERVLSGPLKRQAAEEGADLDRLRKRVAFERFLARLFDQKPTGWVLKGGYALELRLGGRTRATRDVDLDRPPPPAEDLLDELQEAAERDLGEFFVFRVGLPKPMRGAPLGSLRFSVEARLAGKPFTGFALDVGQGDEPLGEAEWKEGQADLDFAGIGRVRLAVYPLADHFVEKLHAYTRPRERRTRVKDLLDLSVILEELAGELPPPEEMRLTIETTFDRYGTHALPNPLPAPPEDWVGPFETEAKNLGLTTIDISRAHGALEEYLRARRALVALLMLAGRARFLVAWAVVCLGVEGDAGAAPIAAHPITVSPVFLQCYLEGSRTVRPELGPGKPRAGSAPVESLRSSRRTLAGNLLPIMASDSRRGLLETFPRYTSTSSIATLHTLRM